ncbi:hypothetical protein OD218_003242 [Salmonella enterica]|nr:hypothetical protein [Salmonella enterica]EJX3098045.1 hypothetical protein [Salmonella enterica]EJX3108121.1 hypothetical protein [Salmonella enterica]EJX3249482.1 hypothetical protein [Salmonella enterica]EJX3459671.1 hypothetical protein [Salmonella enterica]
MRKKVLPMPAQKLSADLHKRINRSQTVSNFMYLEFYKRSVGNNYPLLWLPFIFSYVNDDITAIKEELIKRDLLKR